MTATPARDALVERYHSQPGFHALVHYLMKPGWRDDDGVWHDGPTVADIERVAALVDSEHVRDAYLAALVESGWRPTADQLRAMGGRDGRRVVAVGTLGTFWQFEGVDGD